MTIDTPQLNSSLIKTSLRRSFLDHSIDAVQCPLAAVLRRGDRYGSKGGWHRRDRQTDGRTPDRYNIPCIAHDADFNVDQ